MATRRRATRPRGYTRGEAVSIIAAGLLLFTGTYVSAEIAPPDASATVDEFGDPRPEPRECRDVLKQHRDTLRELTRLEKLLTKAKLTSDLETLGALRGRITGTQAKLATDCTRTAIQDFFDEQPWETVNELRAKAELPKQISDTDRDLKRIEKQATLKTLQLAGLDPAKFTANIATVRQALADAKAGLAAGNYQDAQDALQPIWDGLHPGEMTGVVNRLRDFGREVKRVRDTQIRTQLQEIVAPIVEAANEGDFREANQALNDVSDELMRILRQLTQSRKYRGDLGQKLEQLETQIGTKISSESTATPVAQPKPDAASNTGSVPEINAPSTTP